MIFALFTPPSAAHCPTGQRPVPRHFCRYYFVKAALPGLLAATVLLGSPVRPGAAEVLFVDDTGHEICLKTPAQRIVALYGAFNDILLDMDLGDCLAARTVADTRPELAHLPVIGTHMRPNNELIAALAPDLIIQFQGRGEADTQVAQLRTLGMNVVVFQGASFSNLFRMIKALGELTGEPERADMLVDALQTRLSAVAACRKDRPKPRVFFEIRSPNLLAAGEDSMASAIIEAAGGVNAVHLPDRVARLNEEELIRLDPDVYLIQQGPMNPQPVPLQDRPHYRTLRAVHGGHVLMVDEKMFSRPAPAAVEAVELLAAYLNTL